MKGAIKSFNLRILLEWLHPFQFLQKWLSRKTTNKIRKSGILRSAFYFYCSGFQMNFLFIAFLRGDSFQVLRGIWFGPMSKRPNSKQNWIWLKSVSFSKNHWTIDCTWSVELPSFLYHHHTCILCFEYIGEEATYHVHLRFSMHEESNFVCCVFLALNVCHPTTFSSETSFI